MPESGTYESNHTRNEIINNALRILNIGAIGETPSDELVNTCKISLENVLRSWQVKGIGFWKTKALTLFPLNGISRFTLSKNGDRCAYNVTRTTALNEQTAGSNSFQVASSRNISANYVVGIFNDSSSVQWDTVSLVSSDTITITGALNETLAAGCLLVFYQENAVAPLEIESAFSVDRTGNRYQLTGKSRTDFLLIQQNNASGRPTVYNYEKGTQNVGYLNLWTAPNALDEWIELVCKQPMQDVGGVDDLQDIPPRFIHALTWSLAEELSMQFLNDMNKVSYISQKASALLEELIMSDGDNIGIRFYP